MFSRQQKFRFASRSSIPACCWILEHLEDFAALLSQFRRIAAGLTETGATDDVTSDDDPPLDLWGDEHYELVTAI
jgi:hypothetical protein